MMTVYTYGVAVRNKEGGTDFFAVNAVSQTKALEIVSEMIEGDDHYGHQPPTWVQSITELLHEQFRGVAMLGGC